jgi:hypothetical protein
MVVSGQAKADARCPVSFRFPERATKDWNGAEATPVISLSRRPATCLLLFCWPCTKRKLVSPAFSSRLPENHCVYQLSVHGLVNEVPAG